MPEKNDEKKEIEKNIDEIEDDKIEDKGFNWWALIAVVLGAAFLVSIYTNGFTTFGHKSNTEIKTQVYDFINENFLQNQNANLTITTVKNINNMGLYEISVSVNNGPSQKLYATADGQLLFLQAVPMTQQTPAQPVAQEPQTPLPKTDKPEVNLYVMSYCPYGVLSEKNFIPAIELFGGQIDFNLRFIASENNGTFDSLHGTNEVIEDTRQVCIMKEYPDTYLKYINCQADNYQARKDISETYEDCLTANSMSIEKIDACVTTDGPQLLKENIAYANQKGIGSSPTYEINGVKKIGADATDTFKKAVCSAFNTAPVECGQTLNTTSAAAAGNC